MALVETSLRPNHGVETASHCPPWKLYHNPHYSLRARSPDTSSRFSHSKNRSSMIVPIHHDDGMEQLGEGYVVSVSELELCLTRIEELRAELEFERRMRRKVEALNEALAVELAVELAEERRRGEAECWRLREEAGAVREEMEHALNEIEEDRRMLRVAELWREERVRMKLADAQAAFEEKLREIAGAELHAGATADDGSSSCSSPIGKSSPASSPSPMSGQHAQLHRREANGGGKNPHIRRGIRGFVEFPRAVRVLPRDERVDLVSNIECQRAQLRVLMRHRNPAAGIGRASEKLVVCNSVVI